MSVPFPGMDPYLEHPILWTSVHSRLISSGPASAGQPIRPRTPALVLPGMPKGSSPVAAVKIHQSSTMKSYCLGGVTRCLPLAPILTLPSTIRAYL